MENNRKVVVGQVRQVHPDSSEFAGQTYLILCNNPDIGVSVKILEGADKDYQDFWGIEEIMGDWVVM